MLDSFIAGFTGDLHRQALDKEKLAADLEKTKREEAQRRKERKEERAARREDDALNRKYARQDRAQEKSESVLDTYTNDAGQRVQVLGDGTERPIRKLSQAELKERDQRSSLLDAQINNANRPPRDYYGRDDEEKPLNLKDAMDLLAAQAGVSTSPPPANAPRAEKEAWAKSIADIRRKAAAIAQARMTRSEMPLAGSKPGDLGAAFGGAMNEATQ